MTPSSIRYPLIPLFLLIFAHFSYGQQDLERLKVTKEISMKVPTAFTSLLANEVNSKFVAARQPIATFSSMDRRIDLSINSKPSTWAVTDLSIANDFYKASLLNFFDEVEFIQEDIREIGGREFIIYEFTSKVTDEDSTFGDSRTISKYTYIIYTLHNNRTLIFNFTCPARLKDQWQEAASEIMESVRIK